MYRRLWTMGLRACTHPDMHSSTERERERDMGSSICKRARAHARTCRNAYAHRRCRAYASASAHTDEEVRCSPSKSLCFPFSLFLLLLIAEIYEQRHGEPDMTSEFEYFLADSIDTPFIFPSIALLFIDNASRKVERIVVFSWKILSHSIKILYIWFCWEYGDGTVMEAKVFFLRY